MEAGLYISIMYFVEAINRLIQESDKHSEGCLTVKVSQTTYKNEIYFEIDTSGLALFSDESENFFGSIVGKQFRVMLGQKPTSQRNTCLRYCR